MLRFWLRLTPLVLLCITPLLLLANTAFRLSSSGAVLEYQRFWPSSDIIWANYADVERHLNISLEQFMLVSPITARDTAADGRLARSQPTPGNVDLFLLQADGAETRLTRYGNFPPDRFGVDARRSNLFPRWSSDDRWIAFLSADSSGKTDVYVVQPDGDGLRLVGERIISQIPLRPRWVNLNTAPETPIWALLGLGGVAVLGGGVFYRLRRTNPHT